MKKIKSKNVTQEYIEKATPGKGVKTIQDGFKDVNGEKTGANWLHSTFGGDIVLLADNNPQGESNPDYLWKNKLWDLKSLTTDNKNTIDNRIRHGVKQTLKNPGGLLLDYSESPLKLSKAIIETDTYAQKRAKATIDVIIKKGEKYRVIRVEK